MSIAKDIMEGPAPIRGSQVIFMAYTGDKIHQHRATSEGGRHQEGCKEAQEAVTEWAPYACVGIRRASRGVEGSLESAGRRIGECQVHHA